MAADRVEEFVRRAIGVPFRLRGRDYDGWDCWGACFVCYRDAFDIALPSYADEYASAEPSDYLATVIMREREQAGWLKVAETEPGDVILLRIQGRPTHCGLVIGQGMMLHVELGVNTCREAYHGLLWRHRVFGIWRHPARTTPNGANGCLRP